MFVKIAENTQEREYAYMIRKKYSSMNKMSQLKKRLINTKKTPLTSFYIMNKNSRLGPGDSGSLTALVRSSAYVYFQQHEKMELVL